MDQIEITFTATMTFPRTDGVDFDQAVRLVRKALTDGDEGEFYGLSLERVQCLRLLAVGR